jgi:hypothetical protein
MGLEAPLLAAAATVAFVRRSAATPAGQALVVHEHVLDYTYAGRTADADAGAKRGTVSELPGKQAAFDKVVQLLRDGAKLWVYFDSLKQLKRLRERVYRELPRLPPIVELHGEVSEQTKAELLADLQSQLIRRGAQAVFATSTASIGVSVVGYFDIVVAIFDNRPANEQLQALYRERAPLRRQLYVCWTGASARQQTLPLPFRTVGDAERDSDPAQRRLVSCGGALASVAVLLESVQAETRQLSIDFARPLTLQLLRDDGFDVHPAATFDDTDDEADGARIAKQNLPRDQLRAVARTIERTIAQIEFTTTTTTTTRSTATPTTTTVPNDRFRLGELRKSRIIVATIDAVEKQLDMLRALVQVAFGANAAIGSEHLQVAAIVHNLALIAHPSGDALHGLFSGSSDMEWPSATVNTAAHCSWLSHPLRAHETQTTDEFLRWLRSDAAPKALLKRLFGGDAVRSLANPRATPLSLLRSLMNTLLGERYLRAGKKNEAAVIAWPAFARMLDLLERRERGKATLPKAFMSWRKQTKHAWTNWQRVYDEEIKWLTAQQQRANRQDDEDERVDQCIALLQAHKHHLPQSLVKLLARQVDSAETPAAESEQTETADKVQAPQKRRRTTRLAKTDGDE